MNKVKILILALGGCFSLFAQSEYNPISTTAAFLRISPESRGSAMGDAGIATSADVYSQYWNPAKYATIEDKFGLGVSYTPWLRELVNDIGLIDVTGYYSFDDVQTLSSSLRFFSMGEINGTDIHGYPTKDIEPTELAFDIAYSRKFSDYWSGAVAFRYIRSDLYGGLDDALYAGNAFAADIATYYKNDELVLGGYRSIFSFGANVSNVGSKLSYTKGQTSLFLPTNLGIGTSLEMQIDDYNTITGTIDMNKLLVPTPANSGDDEADDLRNEEIEQMGSLEGVFRSFGDAPGGFKEEMQEIMWSLGLEYTYDNAFSVRGGYFHENENKGNRKFFSVGAGFKMNVFALDVSYLVPVDATSPLANTLRFSLSFGVAGLQNIFN